MVPRTLSFDNESQASSASRTASRWSLDSEAGRGSTSNQRPHFRDAQAAHLQTRQLFRRLRNEHRRHSKASDRPFILADRVINAITKDAASSGPKDLYGVMWNAHSSEKDDPPAFLTNVEIDKRSRIFCILLDIDEPNLIGAFHRLQDTHLPVSMQDLLTATENIRNDFQDEAARHSFCTKFYKTQIEWCPLEFELDMRTLVTDKIIPFYKKKRIEPYHIQGDFACERATLYEIHVPEELVGLKLKEKLRAAELLRGQTRDAEVSDEGDQPAKKEYRYYRFAMKEFPDKMWADFDRERKAFAALKEEAGMIQYYGYFEYRSENTRTYNLVLELADHDLHTAFQKQSPPISSIEIRGFWDQMLGLVLTLNRIHRLDLNGHEYDYWHGDIKPENILRVRDQFKLADPGDGRIRLAQEGNNQPRARIYGGTWTYASPEKADRLLNRSSYAASVFQNSDVWSLGCVMSMAATYLVLGTQGVILFNKIRKNERGTSSADLTTDDFHDGREVLPVVKSWHEYLRSAMRQSDAFTANILTMVDQNMLVPQDIRHTAKQIHDTMEAIMQTPALQPLEAPVDIVEILQQLDLEAVLTIESKSDIDRVDSDMLKRQLKGKPRLQELEGKITSKSEQELSETQILPTAQRSSNREEILRRVRPPQPTDLPRLSTGSFLRTDSTTNPATSTTALPFLDANVPHFQEQPTEIGQQMVPVDPVTKWLLEDELDEKALSTKLLSRTGKKPISAKGRLSVDLLENQFTKRDIIYIVDNGSTMIRHWREATDLLRVLVWRSMGYDDNGMELCFTDPRSNSGVRQSPRQEVAHFVRAMKEAKPQAGRPCKTDIWPRLNHFMMQYEEERRKQPGAERRKTLIVLTDGAWEHIENDEELHEAIKAQLKRLASLHRDDRKHSQTHQDETDLQILERIRPITIQFVAFGQDNLDRMKSLDDDLGKDWPDLIDMEPSTGCAYKMFLGSLVPEWDKQKNHVNSMVSASPARPRRDTLTIATPTDGARSRTSSTGSAYRVPRLTDRRNDANRASLLQTPNRKESLGWRSPPQHTTLDQVVDPHTSVTQSPENLELPGPSRLPPAI